MKRLLLVLAAAVAATSTCTYVSRDAAPYQPPGIRAIGEPDTGFQWYQRDCAWCHGVTGQGTPRGPDVVGDRNGAALTDLMLRSGRMPIEDPAERLRRRPPAYSEETIQQIVDYVASLGGRGPGIPEPDPGAGDLALGQRLYQANCAACHSATGAGGALTQGDPGDVTGDVGRRSGFQAPGFGQVDARDVAESMLTGPGTMPVFGEETFTDHEFDSIVRYVLYLRDSGNRGGEDLGRVGPVTEGAIAWIVGLGALLVLARWIGRAVGGHG